MLAANVPPPMPQEPEVTLMHDARAVHDTATLEFRRFVANGKMMWIVGQVLPAADSGSSTIPGSEMNPKTGEVTIPPGAKESLSKSGTWKATAAAPAAQKHKAGAFSWLEPVENQQHVTTPEDYYSPFAEGGMIVFSFDPAAAGIAQFKSAALIFPDWAGDVAGAASFVESHEGLLELGGKTKDAAQLRRLLTDKNHFLVVESLRELVQSGQLDGHVALDQLTSAAAPIDSVLVYWMLKNPGNEGLAEQVNAAAVSTRDRKKLQSIALGAFSVLLYCKQDAKSIARGNAVLKSVRATVQRYGISPEINSQLYLILSKTGNL